MHIPGRTILRQKPDTLAKGLGWFSIGLGVAELLMPRKFSRTLGMPGQTKLIRAYGLREIIMGMGILSAKHPRPWILGRIGGDAMDLATHIWGIRRGRAPVKAALAAGLVAGVTALDVRSASGLKREDRARQAPDYSDRSGFPKPAGQMRGLARDAARM